MALATRVWRPGRLLVIARCPGRRPILVFAAVAVRVAVRAREVTVPDVTGASVSEAADAAEPASS